MTHFWRGQGHSEFVYISFPNYARPDERARRSVERSGVLCPKDILDQRVGPLLGMASRVLIWGSGSGPCWRVQIALAEKNLKYDSRLIEFSKKGHKTPEAIALNPRGQVPILKDGDVVINESLAAIQYLDQAYPEPPLIPKGSNPQVLQRLIESDNVLTAMRGVFFAHRQQASQEEMNSKIEALKTELGYWESYLGSNTYVAGSEFTLADVAVIPFFLSLERWGAKFTDFPNLAKYLAKIKERSSVDQSWPPHWRETPGLDLLTL